MCTQLIVSYMCLFAWQSFAVTPIRVIGEKVPAKCPRSFADITYGSSPVKSDSSSRNSYFSYKFLSGWSFLLATCTTDIKVTRRTPIICGVHLPCSENYGALLNFCIVQTPCNMYVKFSNCVVSILRFVIFLSPLLCSRNIATLLKSLTWILRLLTYSWLLLKDCSKPCLGCFFHLDCFYSSHVHVKHFSCFRSRRYHGNNIACWRTRPGIFS